MKANKSLRVFYKDHPVGTLALTADRKAAFSYDANWLESGISISPFSLPLKQQVFVPEKECESIIDDIRKCVYELLGKYIR